MVLAFAGSGPAAEVYLRNLAEVNADIEAAQARVLAVVALPPAEARALAGRLGLPFTLLVDEGGVATRRMLTEGARAALAVADRFGQVFSLETAPDASALQPARSALEWLDYILLECPE